MVLGVPPRGGRAPSTRLHTPRVRFTAATFTAGASTKAPPPRHHRSPDIADGREVTILALFTDKPDDRRNTTGPFCLHRTLTDG